MLRQRLVLVLGASIVATSACSSPQEGEVERVAGSFYAAVDRGDGAAACALLSPTTRQELEDSTRKPCDEAVLDEVRPPGTDVTDVGAYGTTAHVQFAADTLFLTRFRGDWLVLAAACQQPAGADTYECGIKGN